MRIAIYLLLLVNASAAPLWELSTGRQNPQALLVDSTRPKYLYLAKKEGGVAVIQIDRKEPREVGLIKKSELADLDAMNLWQQGDYLLVALGDFFKKECHAGLAIVDVKNPIRPKVLSTWESDEPMHGSAVVICDSQKRFAYLGAMEIGVISFDISDPAKPKMLSTFQPDINFPKKSPNRVQMPNARGMVLNRNHLFVANDAGGIRVIDVFDPKKPKEIGRYINLGMKGKQSAYNNLHIAGDLAYVAIDYAGVEILDISDPKRIRQVSWWNPWKAETGANTWFNSPGHTNQIAFDEKKKRVYLSAGDSELIVLDVADPNNPLRKAGHGEPKNRQGVWGLGRGGGTIYLGYIRTIIPFRGSWAGVRAVEVGG